MCFQVLDEVTNVFLDIILQTTFIGLDGVLMSSLQPVLSKSNRFKKKFFFFEVKPKPNSKQDKHLYGDP